jgi:hypothetical protein
VSRSKDRSLWRGVAVCLGAALWLVWMAPAVVSGADRSGTTGPRTVSPGDEARSVTVAAPCPTFSWSGAAGAEAYEVAVYRLTDRGADREPALLEELPGPAFSWTPSRDRCMTPGERYAWAVRARGPGGWGEWSAASLFQVPAAPGREELEQALAVVRSYLAVHSGAAGSLPPRPARPAERAASDSEAGGKDVPEPVRAAVARAIAAPDRVGLSSRLLNQGSAVMYAVHGYTTSSQEGSAGVVGETHAEINNTATYGVLGLHTGNDALGAAGAFSRTNGGDLLVGLFGGLEVFRVDTGGNSLLTGNLDLGGTLACTSCVSGTAIVNGSVTGLDIANGTVTGTDLLNNTVTETDLAAGAVGADELDQVVVVSVECNGECTDITLGQVCGFAGVDKRPVFVDCGNVDNDSGSSCGGDNTCSSFTLDAADSLGSLCTDGSGWDANVYCLDDDDGGYP